MRIQTRLFLGTVALVLAMMAAQYWLHVRQLTAIERELGSVAATVGMGLLDHHLWPDGDSSLGESSQGPSAVWIAAPSISAGEAIESNPVLAPECEASEVHVLALPDGADATVRHRIDRVVTTVDGGTGHEETIEHRIVVDLNDRGDAVGENASSGPRPRGPLATSVVSDIEGERKVELKVVRLDEPSQRFLVVQDGEGERRIPIPVTPTQEIVRRTLNQGLLVSGGLLALAMVASGVMATTLTRPLRKLAEGAEAVAGGGLGVQVAENAPGEIGELQRTFNRMSSRLADLEAEREAWRRREHLAQLGDLSRGLAHTLRNPLNTLGLAVEELAGRHGGDDPLVGVSRHQIRRIDRWLRSFLTLGASDDAATEISEIGPLVEDVVLEAIQAGARVDLDIEDAGLTVSAIPTAVRSAVANLLENATAASPEGESVDVVLRRDGSDALVSIRDAGPGLPTEVRQKLFSPHITTRVGGSGMGLFLARQLVEGMHGGELTLTDRDGGGTVAEIRLPLAGSEADGSHRG